MTEIEAIIDELNAIYNGNAWHADNLKKILDNVSAKQAAERPISSAHSIWEIVLHIAAWNEVWAARLSGDNIDVPRDGDFPPIAEFAEASWHDALKRLGTSQQRLLTKIDDLSDEDLPAQFAQKDYTLGFFLRGIVRHIVYHSGQVAILKKTSAPD